MKIMKLVAQIGEIQLIIVAEAEDIAHMLITKLESSVIMKKSEVQVDAKLQNVSVFDPSSDTIYKHVSTSNKENKLFVLFEYFSYYVININSRIKSHSIYFHRKAIVICSI